MLIYPKCIPFLASTSKVQGIRYSHCCPPPPRLCGPCGSGQGSGRRIPSSSCRPGPIPPNPCVPRYHHGKDTWKKYKALALGVGLPIILIMSYNFLGGEPPHKKDCRDFEYMRIRTKRFPWRDGVESLFHNPHVNHLRGECEPPPLDCE